MLVFVVATENIEQLTRNLLQECPAVSHWRIGIRTGKKCSAYGVPHRAGVLREDRAVWQEANAGFVLEHDEAVLRRRIKGEGVLLCLVVGRERHRVDRRRTHRRALARIGTPEGLQSPVL